MTLERHERVCKAARQCNGCLEIFDNHELVTTHKKTCQLYIQRFFNKQRKNAVKGADWYLKKTSEQLEDINNRISSTMSALIEREPWRKDKMRETAKRTITPWARSEEGRSRSHEHGVEKLSRTFHSIPELKLFNVVREKYGDEVQNSRVVYNKKFTNRSKKRQLDVVMFDRKILVEFDGPYHFKPMPDQKSLISKRIQDAELNEVLSSSGWIVIRVGDSTFHRKTKTFDPETILKVFKHIDENIPGVYKLGVEYDV